MNLWSSAFNLRLCGVCGLAAVKQTRSSESALCGTLGPSSQRPEGKHSCLQFYGGVPTWLFLLTVNTSKFLTCLNAHDKFCILVSHSEEGGERGGKGRAQGGSHIGGREGGAQGERGGRRR
jgi:hypothetical protein